MKSRWTSEREAELRTLWSSGMSPRLIAEQIGGGVSRRSVIDKAAHLGLPQKEVKSRPRDLKELTPLVERAKQGAVTAKGALPPKVPTKKALKRLERDRKALEANKRLKEALRKREEELRQAEKERKAKLAEARRRIAEARRELNRKLGGDGGIQAPIGRPDPFETMRQKWLTAVLYVGKFEPVAGDAEDIIAAKRTIEEIEAEWSRLAVIPKGHPDFFEWPSIEGGTGDHLIDIRGWEVTGMLGYLGYHVGKTSALKREQREMILACAFVSHLPPLNSPKYMRSWGPPASPTRLKKIADSLSSFVRLRKRSRTGIFQEALSAWQDDLNFLYERYYVGRFTFEWPPG